MLTHIVNERYAANLDTIIVTNESLEAAQRSLGQSIVDRIRESGAFVACNWPSFRSLEPQS